MKIKRIYKIIPVPVFYVDSLKRGRAGVSNGFFVRIRKEYRDDEGLLEHELTHCRQFYSTLGLHALFYTASKKYRYKAEVEAYKVQLKYVSNRMESIYKFAKFIATTYGLNVNQDEVERDLL